MERPQPEPLKGPRHLSTPSSRTEQADVFLPLSLLWNRPRHTVISNGAGRFFLPLSVSPPPATPSFRTEQADFFFRFRSCESVGLRREKSLFSSLSSPRVILELRLSHPERFCRTTPPLHTVIPNGASRLSLSTLPPPSPPRHFERSRPTFSLPTPSALLHPVISNGAGRLFLPLPLLPLSATPSFRTEQADFFFRFRSPRSPPPRHFQRRQPTFSSASALPALRHPAISNEASRRFFFPFRFFRPPPPRHFERSKPTLFLPLSLLRKGRLADVRNLSSSFAGLRGEISLPLPVWQCHPPGKTHLCHTTSDL